MFKNEKEYLEAKERHDLLSEQVGELNSAKSKLGEEIRKHDIYESALKHTILTYRGKDSVTGKWIYGYLLKTGADFTIVSDSNGDIHIVDISTVGFCSNIMFEYHKLLCEGDIVKKKDDRRPYFMVVQYGVFDEHCGQHEYTGWYLYALGVKASVSINILNKSDFEVVGNVHDNPELIFDNMHI